MRSNGVDLNRDFPSPLEAPDGPLAAAGTEQPETAAVMRWASETRFAASASMHEVVLRDDDVQISGAQGQGDELVNIVVQDSVSLYLAPDVLTTVPVVPSAIASAPRNPC